MIRAGLIGNGGIGRLHRIAYQRIHDEQGTDIVSLEAICDIRPEQLELEGQCMEGTRKYTDYVEMLEKEAGKLDYIDICVPTFLHAEISIKAMEMGFNVMCEKPMARTVEEANKMIEVSKTTGKTLMIAHCSRFGEEMDLVRELVESGEFGKIRYAEFKSTGGDLGPMGWNNWYYDGKLSGGCAWDVHVHDVDKLRCLFGMPKAVSSMGRKGVMVSDGAYDAICTNYMFENGIYVNIVADWTTIKEEYNWRMTRVNFEKGYVFADRWSERSEFVKVAEDGTKTDYHHLWGPKFPFKNKTYVYEILYYVDCLKNGKPVDFCPPEQSRDNLRIIMAEIESANNGGKLVEL